MDAISGVASLIIKIKRTCAERIIKTRLHSTAIFSKFGLTAYHWRGRCPCRPFAFHGNLCGARPTETFAPNTDAIAHGFAVWHYEIKELFFRVDDNRAWFLICFIVDNLTTILRGDFLTRNGGNCIASVSYGAIGC